MRHASYWEADMPAAPPSGELAGECDVLIIGAGFMGRWLAYFLRGLRVQVIERDGFTYGASSRNAGFLTCGQISEMLADVEHAGIEQVIDTCLRRRRGMEIVRRELGIVRGAGMELTIDPCGSFDYDAVTGQGLRLMRSLNAALGEEVYSLKPACFGGQTRDAYFNRVDGAVHPVRLLRLLQERATHARFAFGVNALRAGDGRAEVQIAGGRREIRYRRAFVCTNAFAADLDPSSRVVPGRGQVIVTSPVTTATSKTLGYMNQGYDYFRFVGGPSSASGQGRLLIGGGRNRFPSETGTAELLPTVHVREWLEQQARAVIGHDDWQVEHHWAGIMGFIGGNHLGGSPRRRVDAQTEVVAGFGGMGVALAPLYAEQIAEEM